MKYPKRGWNARARDAFKDLKTIERAYRHGRPVLKRYYTGALSRLNTAFRDAAYASERRHGGRHKTGAVSVEFQNLATLADDIKNVQAWLKKPRGFYSGGAFIAELTSKKHRSEKADPWVLKGVRAVLWDMREWLPVARFFRSLPEPEDTKPTYQPRKARHAAMYQVQVLLRALVEQYRADVEKAIAKNMREVVDAFLRCSNGQSPHDYYWANRSYGYDVVIKCLEAPKNQNWSKPRWKKDGRKWLADAAKRQADKIADTFIAKNMRKLGAIVDQKEKKSKLKSCTVTETRIEAGAFEGTFHLAFLDGSSFDARNIVVYALSVNGKPFCRYPTTFHNVVWSDGRTVKKQSEKQMNESWAR